MARVGNLCGRSVYAFFATLLSVAPAAQAATFVVTKTSDHPPGAIDPPDGCLPTDCTLREAVIDANQAPGIDEIELPAGLYLLTRTGTDENAADRGDLDIVGDATIVGAGSSNTIIDGNGTDRVFEILTSSTVEFRDLSVRNGRAIRVGGGGIRITSGADVTIARARFTANSTDGSNTLDRGGGAIVSDGASLVITDTVFDRNSTLFFAGHGGAIEIGSGGGLTLDGSTFTGNSAQGVGGALRIGEAATASVARCTFIENTTDGSGGAVSSAGSLQITDSSFRGNAAPEPFGNGGAVDSANDGTISIVGSTFSNNSSAGDGGAVRVSFESSATIANTRFGGNVAGREGGAVSVDFDGVVSVSDSVFSRNAAGGSGGGAVGASNSALSIARSTFDGNTSDGGGGAISSTFSTATTTIARSSFNGNATRYGSGGAVQVDLGDLEVTACSFHHNRADHAGGAISSGRGTTTITDCDFRENASDGDGGALVTSGAAISHSTFADNSAEEEGGALRGSDVTITNSTFRGNRSGFGESGGALSLGPDDAVITSSTFTANEAGGSGDAVHVGSGGTATLTNTLVDGSCADDFGEGTFVSSGGNIESVASTCGFTEPTDQTGVLPPTLELGALECNGGLTDTIALGPGSVAIDAGTNASCPAIDQRHAEREDGACDVGAFEAGAEAPPGNCAVGDPNLVFYDGFQSGDTASWSVTVPGVEGQTEPARRYRDRARATGQVESRAGRLRTPAARRSG